MVNVAKGLWLQDETIIAFYFGGGGQEACLKLGGRRRFFRSLPAPLYY